jgi:hypothetical protein
LVGPPIAIDAALRRLGEIFDAGHWAELMALGNLAVRERGPAERFEARRPR